MSSMSRPPSRLWPTKNVSRRPSAVRTDLKESSPPQVQSTSSTQSTAVPQSRKSSSRVAVPPSTVSALVSLVYRNPQRATPRTRCSMRPRGPMWTATRWRTTRGARPWQRKRRGSLLTTSKLVISGLIRGQGQPFARFPLTTINPTFVVGPLFIDEQGASITVGQLELGQLYKT